MVSRTENALSAALTRPSRSTPVMTRKVRTTTRIQPRAVAARLPIRRSSFFTVQRYSPRSPRPTRIRRAKKTAAIRGEAIASGTLYSVISINERIWLCQYCPSANDTAKRTTALMAKTRQAPGRGGRGPRSAKARQIDATSTPRPYPMAAVTPVTMPWMRPLRGSSDGVNERQANSSAPQHPGRVACSCRRALPGAFSGAVGVPSRSSTGGRTASPRVIEPPA